MSDQNTIIHQNIIRDMSEGVLSLTLSGKITTVNKAALSILEMSEEEIVGKAFASVFFEHSENDAFNQTVLDAIYEDSTVHNSTVDYYNGNLTKKLFVSTSFIKNGDEKIGVAAVLNDITELCELQNAVLAMEKIKSLNSELEKRNEFIQKIFGRYLSDEIVNKLLDSRDGLVIGGEKRTVTIMFTDIRGFTSLSESMLPYDLIKMLNNYLEEMILIVQKHKGTILEFIGDAIVAVFGAPLESDSGDLDAVSCAIEMQCAMEKVNVYNTSNGFPDMEMGIGIHTGEAVLGNIGSEKKAKYDIIGKNVNLASRIETYTVGGQILVSQVVKDNLGSALKLRGELEILPKGVSAAIKIYDVSACEKYKMPDNTQHFVSLERLVDIQLQIIDGKFASTEKIAARIIEKSEKQIKIISDTQFKKSMNVKFLIDSDEVFAKVVSQDEHFCVLHLTKGVV